MGTRSGATTVSYTHLDVYKRQVIGYDGFWQYTANFPFDTARGGPAITSEP